MMRNKKWVKAADLAEFQATDRKLVDLGGKNQIGLFKINGDFLAVSAWSSHQRATMVHGPLDGYELTCPLHGARFDLRTGAALSLPAVRGVKTFPVKVENDEVHIKV